MRFLVMVKQVPVSSEVEIDEKTGVIKRETGEAKMNPYDLFALEEALRLRQRYGGEVHVLTMGPPQAESVVREAFMMGADDGWLLTDRAIAGSDVLATSYALSQAVTKIGGADLIFCGKQTTDGDTAQVGSECSEFLGIPCVTAVHRIISLDADHAVVESDTGAALQTVRLRLPALIGVDKDINQPRFPSYIRLKQTAGKPVRRLAVADLPDTDTRHYGLDGSPTQVVRIFPPEASHESAVWETGDLAGMLYDYVRREKFLQEAG